MEGIGMYRLLVWVSSTMCLICVSLGYEPEDNYLIACGSPTNKSVGDRVFLADNFDSRILSTPQNISVSTNLNSISSTFGSELFQSARLFNGTSNFTFPIKKQGRHLTRLYFFPFVDEDHNLSMAKFSVSAQTFTLLENFQPQSDPVVKEYSLNITSDNLVLTFIPSSNSFAFLNGLEFFSLPDELMPDSVKTIDSPREHLNLHTQALETVLRVNMGNQRVLPQNDTLWRLWVSDDSYLKHSNLVEFLSRIGAVNDTGGLTQNIAPLSVYGTATALQSQSDPNTYANITWLFDVDPGFEYLVRFHFCDIVRRVPRELFFNVYINSLFVARDLDLSNLTSNVLGAPFYMDILTGLSDSSKLNVSVGPTTSYNAYPNAILNGLEIMKVNNSRGSLHVAETGIQSSKSSSKLKVWVIAVSTLGLLFIVILALVLLAVCRRRRRRLAHVATNGGGSPGAMESKYFNGNAISMSKVAYSFPFVAVQEATDNFNESLVIGTGGFGKVYKGVLRDNTKVAVKRGVSESQQGLAEFRTEIEMLSQFRHRHLVSLIGYCNERNEMIIIYEYMENGTLKDHLYGSNLRRLSWRQRLEICIGSARGLHYLHTGYANAIIHRDVKSANILLDENFMAKVADFGLSKNGPEIDQTHVSTAVKGSFGYLDPEYLTTQQLNEKSDVYSFGVVMFEILCGRPVIDPSLSREMVNLVEWAMKWQKREELEKVIDPHLVGKMKPESLRKYCDLAEKCLAESGVDRPTMGDVLWNLEYALQLQTSESPRPNGELSHPSLETSVSNTQFSMGSVSDLAGTSMSKVFSEMVRAEMG